MTTPAPWLAHYGNVPHTLTYPAGSMAQIVLDAAEKYPTHAALDFFGIKTTYATLADDIRLCARGLADCGIARGARVTICMPNTPQAVVMLYALNLLGAIAHMIHPLSAPEEIRRYMEKAGSVAVMTLDQFASNLLSILPKTTAKTLILAGVEDGLSGIKKPLYRLTKGRKIERRPSGGEILRYTDLLERGRKYHGELAAHSDPNDVAAILQSGGTSGDSKGILLTNLNFNALAMQTAAAGDCVIPGNKMLAIMPVFHGFGLGVCIHTTLMHGAQCILVPQFSIESYAKLLKKHRPHYIPGVPTLFEALLRLKGIEKLDLSQLMGVFCGGDSLTIELKRKVDQFLKDHGSEEQIRQGYGMTESVTASCLTPRHFHKEGSIGVPYPDMMYKIVRPDSQDELPYGEEGEIAVSGPTVMKGYDGESAENEKTLQTHPDGRIWLHTGDLGTMDSDGFIYFKGRLKRLIISSGYNIYPAALENIIEEHEAVLISCVIGVPDNYKMSRPKAFIILRDGQAATEEIRQSIHDHCRANIAKYAMPAEFEYRESLPRTLIGKVAYRELEEEETNKREAM
ncbi:MAG: AMP-binding protein [Oscillospiraceae bacterium]|nr:AMP-binding protein [Oscillospiraceae bacterium]